jgi:CheY-like chemotaxis protein
VEPSAEERTVLRTVLETRGLRIWEAAGTKEGLEIARERHPDVIVLDLEAQWADRDEVHDQFAADADGHQPAIVILGKARRQGSLPPGQVIKKPYHYGPLVHTIEQLAAAKAA